MILEDCEQRFRTGQWYHVPANTIHAAKFEEFTTEIEFWFKVDSPPETT